MSDPHLVATEPRATPTVRGQLSRPQLLRLALLFTCGQIVVAWALDGVTRRSELSAAFRFSPNVAALTASALVLGTLAGLGIAVAIRRWSPLSAIAERVVPLVDWASFGILDFTLLAACAGVGEEILFRGAVQPIAGVVIQALLFGALHWTCNAHVVIATLAGLAFGVLVRASESLWPGIAAHFAVDLTTGLALAAALRRGWLDESGRFRDPSN